MFDTNQQPMMNIQTIPKAELDRMIIETAKLRADMKAAIAAAPTYNIRSQLRYRLNHGVYKYDDLVDQKSVIEEINRPIVTFQLSPIAPQSVGGYGTSNTDAK